MHRQPKTPPLEAVYLDDPTPEPDLAANRRSAPALDLTRPATPIATAPVEVIGRADVERIARGLISPMVEIRAELDSLRRESAAAGDAISERVTSDNAAMATRIAELAVRFDMFDARMDAFESRLDALTDGLGVAFERLSRRIDRMRIALAVAAEPAVVTLSEAPVPEQVAPVPTAQTTMAMQGCAAPVGTSPIAPMPVPVPPPVPSSRDTEAAQPGAPATVGRVVMTRRRTANDDFLDWPPDAVIADFGAQRRRDS